MGSVYENYDFVIRRGIVIFFCYHNDRRFAGSAYRSDRAQSERYVWRVSRVMLGLESMRWASGRRPQSSGAGAE